MGCLEDFLGIFDMPISINGGFIVEMILFVVMPIWSAFVVGVVVGWAWRPSWWDKNKFDSFLAKMFSFSSLRENLNGFNMSLSSSNGEEDVKGGDGVPFSFGDASGSSSKIKKEEQAVVNDSDLIYLYKVVEEKEGGPSWISMMDRSTLTMSYHAWRRDMPNGPPQYRSSTIFEDATPELVRDFFWDCEFRSNWDHMLIHHETLEESHSTGTMILKWIRKFPFFCSDREYIIGRRIWESGRDYYCLTKGIPNNIPRKDKPRRVDLYYSSWCVRPVESKRGTGQITACEVLFFHHEDMGIPWELAKLGIRQGMWGAVKKIDPGLRAYQKYRASGGPLSPQASMAHITTKVNPQVLTSISTGDDKSITEVAPTEEKQQNTRMVVPKLLVVGGAVALACSLDQGLVTKAVIFGVARKLGKIGGKF